MFNSYKSKTIFNNNSLFRKEIKRYVFLIKFIFSGTKNFLPIPGFKFFTSNL